ncbi:hypothetical protein ACFP2F_10020 [Hymenobacter artigasi]|uniref:DUF4258 domain-containing protein n=1 Tax=Hymenobacter artigasi TaxID=2719616 RepID=A0ABX1HI25_9BACT|nr:hypothetical protein [Hymenobacter artigasi]NKI89913.1 hypothetical protein [Hymenobacter artigasi]
MHRFLVSTNQIYLMALRKKEELSGRAMKRVLKRAAEAVVAENTQKGFSITVLENGQIIEIDPDGTKRVIRENAPRVVQVSTEPFTLE